MGASVRPTPSGDQLMANIQAMRAQGASDDDVAAYLHGEGIQPDAPAIGPAVAEQPDPSASMGYGMRLATHVLNAAQGIPGMEAVEAGAGALGSHLPGNAPMTYGESLQNLRQMTGNIGGKTSFVEHLMGSLPTLPFLPNNPVLAGATLGGADQALNATPTSLKQRAENTAMGAGVGGAVGAVLHGAGGLAGVVANRINPELGVAKAARSLLAPSDATRLANVDEIAPGGGSVASVVVPKRGVRDSRFMSFLRAVGANPEAGASAENSITGQQAALETARRNLGSQMEAIQGKIPVDDKVRDAMALVDKALGTSAKRGADLPPDVNPMGLEKSTPFEFDPQQKTLNIQDLRETLSELRDSMRRYQLRGPDAPGITKRDIGRAIGALSDVVNEKAPPGFADLDRQYGTVMDQLRQTDRLLKTVQRSRANYAANSAYGKGSGSLGGSLPSSMAGIKQSLSDLIHNPAGAADATARLLVAPGGAENVQRLLNPPLLTPRQAARYGLLAIHAASQ